MVVYHLLVIPCHDSFCSSLSSYFGGSDWTCNSSTARSVAKKELI